MAGGTQSSSNNPQTSNGKSTIPPGMVMGPDGKPCKVCTAFRNWSPRTSNHTEPGNSKGAHTQPLQRESATAMMAALAGGTVASSAVVSSSARADEPPPNCPPDVEQLGRATWSFLHTTAAYYPDKPTPVQRANMLALIRSLPLLYPCSWCATDFGEDLQRHPPEVSSRERLSRWLCERHNEVNEKLGKEKFDCATVDERWKDGPSDGRCD